MDSTQTLTQDTNFQVVESKPRWGVSRWDRLIRPMGNGSYEGKIPRMGEFLFEMYLDSASDYELYETIASVNTSFKYPFKNQSYREIVLDILQGLEPEIKRQLGFQWFGTLFAGVQNVIFIQKPNQEPMAGICVEERDFQFSAELLIRMRSDGFMRGRAGVNVVKCLKSKYLKDLYNQGYKWLYANTYHPKTQKLIEFFNKDSKVKWKCLGDAEAFKKNGAMYVPRKYRLNLERFVTE